MTQVYVVAGQKLNDREIEILNLVARGLTDPAIAKRLNISPYTVHTYLARVRVKLRAHNKAQCVALGFVHGYLRLTAKAGT
jgi:DNA-binding CsgD family transcriptional regulator